MGDEAVLIFIAPPDPDVLRERLSGRGTDSAEAIERRLETAKQELEAQQEFKHVVVNDDLERAVGRAGRDRAGRAGRLRTPSGPGILSGQWSSQESKTFSSEPIRITPPFWWPRSERAS